MTSLRYRLAVRMVRPKEDGAQQSDPVERWRNPPRRSFSRVAVTHRQVGRVPVEIHSQSASTDAAILFLHGGGYVAGSARDRRRFAGRLARAAGLPLWSVDYRLAPEHPYPAALDDALEAYRVLRELHPRVVIAGESAGGGLAVATALAAAQRGLPRPVGLALMFPWLDLTCSQQSVERNAGSDVLAADDLARCARSYAGSTDLRDPLVSPLYCDVRELPATFIQVGELDLLADECSAFHSRIQAGAGSSALSVWPGMVHGFCLAPGLVPESTRALAETALHVRRMVTDAASALS